EAELQGGRHRLRRSGSGALAQLAVLVAPAVVRGAVRGRLVEERLARQAAADAGQRRAPRLGDLVTALLADAQALAGRQPLPRAPDRVLDARVDLFLHGPVAGPSIGHAAEANFDGRRRQPRATARLRPALSTYSLSRASLSSARSSRRCRCSR